jgi:hypothetical protein
MKSILQWGLLGFTLIHMGCASLTEPGEFKFIPLSDEAFPEAEEAELYRHGLGRPHQVIGEVAIVGGAGVAPEFLEERLLEGARRVGAQGVIVVATDQTVTEVGVAGIRHDSFGGASKQYRFYPFPVPIEEERIAIRGIAVRFIGE